MKPGAWGVPLPSPITESKFFNAARQTVTLLVEAGVDQRFWRMHCVSTCFVRHHGQGGRAAVLEALKKGRAQPDAALLAVLDADLDRVEGRLPQDPDVVWTDAHDLETTLLGLPVLEKMAMQRVGGEKMAGFESEWGESLRERLFRHAALFGQLRWLKQRERLDDLVFKKKKGNDVQLFDNYHKCTGGGWSPSGEKIVKAVIDYSSAGHLRGRDFMTECASLPGCDLNQLCNGHDLVGFLAAWMNEVSTRERRNAAELTEALAGYCERPWLAETAMWRGIQLWEVSHHGFHVLAS